MMPRPSALSPLQRMDALDDLMARFEARAATDPRLAGAALDEAIRLVPGKRAILGGRFDGQAAIFRFHLSASAKGAAREWAEISRAATHMNAAPESTLRVPAPLCHLPELGLVVVERAPGTPMMELVQAAPLAARPALIRPAAAWLRAYTDATAAPAPVRLDGWFRRAGTGLAQLRHPSLRALKSEILVELHRLGHALAGGTWRQAIGHGDFHPNNLLVEGARLTGIDTGGSARLPICRDMARFAVHLARRGIALSGETRFGVDSAGLDAFDDGFGLSERERALALPFFIGIEALIQVETRPLGHRRVRCAQRMCAALFDDLRGIAR